MFISKGAWSALRGLAYMVGLALVPVVILIGILVGFDFGQWMLALAISGVAGIGLVLSAVGADYPIKKRNEWRHRL